MMPPRGISTMMVDTPLGRFVLSASARGIRSVVPEAAGRAAVSRPIAGAVPAEDGGAAALEQAARWLSAYAEGDPRPYPGALDLGGTEFERIVWRRLLEIPFGGLASYGEIAGLLGIPGDARRVGAAVAANPAAILVPCHRVVGARGTLTGYAWGLDLKRRLIAHEALDTPFRLSAPGASRIHEAAPHPAGDPRSLA